MQCGPLTETGKIAPTTVSPACTRLVPELAALGVESELWLGETDGVDQATTLMKDADSAVAALLDIQKNIPGLTGFNFDFEVQKSAMCGAERCDKQLASFLRGVRAGLAAVADGPVPRVTIDVDCSNGDGWSPIMSNCSLLSEAADKALNMGTYDASSYRNWLQALEPTLAPSIDPGRLGMGLGCYIKQGWGATSESAEQRLCKAMNLSVAEIDLYALLQG